MKKIIFSVLFLLSSGSFLYGSPPIYGPLQTQNNFSEIEDNGTQSTAEINLFGYTITLSGNLETSGSNSLTFTTTGTTNITLPTSGTLLTTNGNMSGGTINNTTIGATTPSTGAFTTLSATGAVTGIGFIGVQTFTTSGTYTPDVGTQDIIVDDQAPGGGTGGCASTSTNQACTSGGSAGGSFAEVLIASGFSGTTVTIGAEGNGGAAGDNNGTAGGSTSFGTFVSCNGGPASAGSTANTPSTYSLNGGAPPSTAPCTTSSDTLIKSIAGRGGDVGAQWNSAGNGQMSGAGGSSALGAGGTPAITTTSSSGTLGTGYGYGSSGSVSIASQPAVAGSHGGPSEIIIYEFN